MDTTTLIGLVANITSAVVEEEPKPVPTLTWVNVAIASSFILINGELSRILPQKTYYSNLPYKLGLISLILGLQLEKTLIIAAVRCLVQLTIMVSTSLSTCD